jgi:hypothetical protein
MRACHRYFLFPVPNYHTEFLMFLRSSPPFCLPLAPSPQAASSREIGIGGDGEYCGDNDAHLGRINVFYHEASGDKSAPRTVLYVQRARRDRRCALVAAHTRGKNWAKDVFGPIFPIKNWG